ncbi:MAG: hypothetical protein HY690_10260 [Chloroflexi bacterium]|nr:hypothetical protein [Chloroflexota bacterium]
MANEGMDAAYRFAARAARESIQREDPAGAEALEQVAAADIVVVPGTYDRVERVLELLGLPFTLVQPHQLHRAGLRPGQLIVVNCPGYGLERQDVAALREVVGAGATLFSTDWALRHVLEQALPGYLAWNSRATGDEVVGVEVVDHENPWLKGVMAEGEEPRWWLEGASYPITVLRPEAVRVLMRSSELSERYGEPAVAVSFGFGDGEVLHLISHYYLQRTELRSERQQATGGATVAFLAAKAPATIAEETAAVAAMSVGEAESAWSSARLFANVVAGTKKRAKRR